MNKPKQDEYNSELSLFDEEADQIDTEIKYITHTKHSEKQHIKNGAGQLTTNQEDVLRYNHWKATIKELKDHAGLF